MSGQNIDLDLGDYYYAIIYEDGATPSQPTVKIVDGYLTID